MAITVPSTRSPPPPTGRNRGFPCSSNRPPEFVRIPQGLGFDAVPSRSQLFDPLAMSHSSPIMPFPGFFGREIVASSRYRSIAPASIKHHRHIQKPHPARKNNSNGYNGRWRMGEGYGHGAVRGCRHDNDQACRLRWGSGTSSTPSPAGGAGIGPAGTYMILRRHLFPGRLVVVERPRYAARR